MAPKLELTFDEFGWQALIDEADRQGVTIEELVAHAAMYYLANADRERLSHRVLRAPRDPEPGASADEARRQL
jgi:hypothetical protein